MRRIPALVLTASAILLVSAPADAASLKSARFKATINAVHTTTWTRNYSGPCGTETGSGSSRVTFHQARPFTLTFQKYLVGARLLSVRVGGGPSPSQIPIKGEMSRNGKLAFTTLPQCQGTGQTEGPPVTPPKIDCGTKSFRGTIRPTWTLPEYYPTLPGAPAPLVPVFWLDEPYSTTQFVTCPWAGPLIQFRLTRDGLPEKKVFGRQPRLKLTDSVKQVDITPRVAAGVRSVTTISWTVKLTRLGR
jgi:hypothetical protein